MPNRPSVIAHRGVHSETLTENTMAAFEAALAAGAEMIELDVRVTGADELVIMHDEGRDGVTLASASRAEFAEQTGFEPPLLREVLDWAKGRITLDVELKEPGQLEAITAVLHAYQRDGGELIVSSFDDSILEQVSELVPSLRLGLLVMLSTRNVVKRAKLAGADIVLPLAALTVEPLPSELAAAELELIVWDFLPDRDEALLSDPRVAGVITDDVPGTLFVRATAEAAATAAKSSDSDSATAEEN